MHASISLCRGHTTVLSGLLSLRRNNSPGIEDQQKRTFASVFTLSCVCYQCRWVIFLSFQIICQVGYCVSIEWHKGCECKIYIGVASPKQPEEPNKYPQKCFIDTDKQLLYTMKRILIHLKITIMFHQHLIISFRRISIFFNLHYFSVKVGSSYVNVQTFIKEHNINCCSSFEMISLGTGWQA